MSCVYRRRIADYGFPCPWRYPVAMASGEGCQREDCQEETMGNASNEVLPPELAQKPVNAMSRSTLQLLAPGET